MGSQAPRRRRHFIRHGGSRGSRRFARSPGDVFLPRRRLGPAAPRATLSFSSPSGWIVSGVVRRLMETSSRRLILAGERNGSNPLAKAACSSRSCFPSAHDGGSLPLLLAARSFPCLWISPRIIPPPCPGKPRNPFGRGRTIPIRSRAAPRPCRRSLARMERPFGSPTATRRSWSLGLRRQRSLS